MTITVFGGKGFIGSNILKKLTELRLEYYAPLRGDSSVFERDLGHVIYCAGLTSDYRERPIDTVKAHVSFLLELIERATFESFLYISSTRVYYNNSSGSEEASLLVNPTNSDDIFNLSKLTGESLCLSVNKPNVKIARLSNVCGEDFGSNNFLFSIIKDAVEKNHIKLFTTLDSEKDYITISDVVNLLIKISLEGKQSIYNVASGKNISNQQIISIIKEMTNCEVTIDKNAKLIKFPLIDVSRIKNEFNYETDNLYVVIKDLINLYKNNLTKK